MRTTSALLSRVKARRVAKHIMTAELPGQEPLLILQGPTKPYTSERRRHERWRWVGVWMNWCVRMTVI